MTNELYWIILVLVNFGLILTIFKLWGRQGLYVWVGFAMVLANIQVIKTIELFGVVATLGNIIYGTTFLATDILSEIYGKKEAKKAVWIGFFTIISSTIIMWLSLKFIPHSSDFAHESLAVIFSVMPRIALASITAYIVSNLHDVWAYHFWKKKFNKIWIQNNLSTMISQLIDSVIFCFIAFWGSYEPQVFMQILLTTYFIKWIVAAADTPFVYLANKFK